MTIAARFRRAWRAFWAPDNPRPRVVNVGMTTRSPAADAAFAETLRERKGELEAIIKGAVRP